MSMKIVAVLSVVGTLTAGPAAAQTATVGVDLARTYGLRPDVVYHTASGEDLTLDLYVPRGADGETPVVIYYHGGGWVLGNRHEYSLYVLPYLEKGFAVANVTYRLAGTALAPAAVVDAVCALRWISRNAPDFGGDPERIVVTGHSAGGHLALIVGMLPSVSPFANECAIPSELIDNGLEDVRAAAVVNWFGITDVADLLVEPRRQMYAEQWIGGQLNGEEIARSVSPLQYVSINVPPIITVHGDEDPIVPYEHAVRLRDAVSTVGGVSELVTVRGGGHGGFAVSEEVDAYARIWSFLAEHGILK